MKTAFVLALVISLFGCSTPYQKEAILNPEQATELARRLANDKTEALYKCQPFASSPRAQLVDGGWVWQDRRGQGNSDVEATVKFALNGANPNVDVVWMDGRADIPALRTR